MDHENVEDDLQDSCSERRWRGLNLVEEEFERIQGHSLVSLSVSFENKDIECQEILHLHGQLSSKDQAQ